MIMARLFDLNIQTMIVIGTAGRVADRSRDLSCETGNLLLSMTLKLRL